MQIKPSTAADRNVGIDDISTIDSNVHAGAKYMRFLADRYFSGDEIDDLNGGYSVSPPTTPDPRRLPAIVEKRLKTVMTRIAGSITSKLLLHAVSAARP